MEGEPSTIIGVVAKYYQQSPKEQHIPMLLRYEDNADYFSIRLNTNDMSKTLTKVKETWNQIFPNTLFHYFFLDEKYNQQYNADIRFGKVIARFPDSQFLSHVLGYSDCQLSRLFSALRKSVFEKYLELLFYK